MDLSFQGRVRVPVIAAPMFLVSCPKLALATCAEGVIGSFPAHSTRTVDVFEEWLVEMEEGIAKLREAGGNPAPLPSILWSIRLIRGTRGILNSA